MGKIIGICGPSGSGKSTIAKELSQHLHANVISIDNYFFVDPPLKKYPQIGMNRELPENIDWPAVRLLINDIHSGTQLLTVRSFNWQQNDYSTISVQQTEYTIIEGFLLLHDEEVVKALDLNIYIDIPDAVGMERRMKREGTEINKKWFQEVTFPEYSKRRKMFEDRAILVIDGLSKMDDNLNIILNNIKQDY